MKCEKMKVRTVYVDWKGCNICYYDPNEVDAAIAELKQKLHDTEMAKDLAEAANTEYRIDIEKFKAENESLGKAMMTIEKVAVAKLRSTRRALLLMCAKRAKAEAYAEDTMADLLLRGGTSRAVDYHRFERDKWNKKAEICKAKADDYK